MSNVEGNATAAVPQWTLGDRLAKARRHADISRVDIAEYLGLSPQAISNYETDSRPVKLQTLRLWALRCGVPLDWLRHGDPLPTNRPPGYVSRVVTLRRAEAA